MRAAYRRFAAGTCLSVLVNVGVALGQGAFHFEDDFNRDAWDNGQTNAFLPAWSAPGSGGFVVPLGSATTAAPFFVGEVVVTGTHMQVRGNGLTYLELDDPELAPGSVGVLSWRNLGTTLGMPRGGSRWENLTVLGGDGQPILQENWQPAVGPWKTVNPKTSAGTAADANTAIGNFRWNFLDGAIIEDSDTFIRPTEDPTPDYPVPPHTGIDFLGPTAVYTGAGSNDWTNYRVRTRMRQTDDDGFGLIVHCFEDANTIQFYRIHFCGTQVDNTGLRPVRGIGIQKAVITKSTGATVWTKLLNSTAFIYVNNRPFDVTVTVQNVSAAETKLQVDIIDDAVANPTPIAAFIASDTTSPIQSGTVGFMAWAALVGSWSSYGGVSTPFVETLDGSPTTLLGDIFTGPYNGWKKHIYAAASTSGNKTAERWGSLLLGTGDLLENSDGGQTDGTTTGGVPAGNWTPWLLFKDGFTTGANYTLRSTMRTDDNDGQGLVFGYTENGDDSYSYFRVAFRAETGSNFGFATGISVQKVVKASGSDPVITNLGISAGRGARTNLAGVWIKKLGTGTIEQVSPANMADGSGKPGVEFQGPRLVAGDVAWTDYTFESVYEVHDDWPFGPIFRFQDEKNFYRLTFNGNSTGAIPPGAAPTGLSIQKVVNGVYSELWKDTDPTKSGNNDVDATAGFIYDGTESATGYRTWRTRVILTGGTIKIEIDAILDDATEFPNYYTATITDPTPLTNGKIGFHTYAQTANEFRNIKVWTTDPNAPVFTDGVGTPDAKGWVDATIATMSNPSSVEGEQGGTDGVTAGTPISGFGIRPDLNAMGVRDNRYIQGNIDSPGEAGSGKAAGFGTVDFDGPKAVAGKPNWKDYSYTVDLRNFDDDGTGVVFRYKDEATYYRLMFQSQSGNTLGSAPRGTSVQKKLNGTWSELFFTTDFVYTIGGRWRVTVTATGSHFTIHIVELDGPRFGLPTGTHDYSFDDPTDPILAGKVGVTAWGSNGSAAEINSLDGLPLPGLDWTKNFDESGTFDNVVVDGTMGRLPPDLDGDGFVDQDDVVLWTSCFTGPDIPLVNPSSMCEAADVDLDHDVDQDDFALVQRCYNGDTLPVNPACVN